MLNPRQYLILLFLSVATPLSAQNKAASPTEKAAADYERSMVTSVPYRINMNQFCDEQVGRWCVIWDRGEDKDLPPEPEAIQKARNNAIAVFAAAFDSLPGDSTIAGPLVRYYIEANDPQNALAVARRFAESTDTPEWGDFLLALALHAGTRDLEAEAVFARALRRMLPTDRVRMLDVVYLLSSDEQKQYLAMPFSRRGPYYDALWQLADPLYLTEGNESLVEHLARGVYSRILAMAPRIAEDDGWTRFDHQLLMRYGRPVARSQNFGQGMGKRLVQYSEPNQLTYVPPALSKGALAQFEPGSPWPYDTVRRYSGYAPRSIRRMRVLEHQVARFPMGDSTIVRIDLALPHDSAVSYPTRMDVGLFVLDSMYQVVGAIRDTVDVDAPNTSRTLTMTLPAQAYAYSVEALDLGSRLAARGRNSFPARSGNRPIVSDLVILAGSDASPPGSRRDPAFQPLSTLVVPRETPIALYLEARSLVPDAQRRVRYRVELEVLEQDKPGTFSRVVRGLGRVLGVSGDAIAPRVTWTQDQAAAATNTIALQLGAVQLEPGLKLFRITLIDLQTNGTVTVERLVRVPK